VVVTGIVAGTESDILAMVKVAEFEEDPVVLTIDVGSLTLVENELLKEVVDETPPLMVEIGKATVIDIEGGVVPDPIETVDDRTGTPDSVEAVDPANVEATDDVGPTTANVEVDRRSVLTDLAVDVTETVDGVGCSPEKEGSCPDFLQKCPHPRLLSARQLSFGSQQPT
jgi:hypothetical protein